MPGKVHGQEQPGALSVRKLQQRGTRATEDGGLGGRTAAGPGGTKARGAVDTAEGCCAAPRARDGCSAGQAWVLMLHRTHVRHAWRKSVGGGGSSGRSTAIAQDGPRAQGGPIWWDGGGRWERRVWASALPPSHSPAVLPPGILKGIDIERACSGAELRGSPVCKAVSEYKRRNTLAVELPPHDRGTGTLIPSVQR